MLHKPQKQPFCHLIGAILLLTCGLVLFRVGLINYTNHISNKSPTRNPFVESSTHNQSKKRWNTNLYGKAVFFILENESFDSAHNNNNWKPPSGSASNEGKSTFSLFGQLEKDQPSNCFFRRLSLTKPNSYLAKVLSFMTGSNPTLFEVGSRIPYPNAAIEDSILFQMTQSGLKSVGFVNDSWDAVYKDLFTSKEVLQDAEQSTNTQEGRYSQVVNKLKSNIFDLVIVSDSISSFKTTSSKTPVEQIEEQFTTIFDAMDNDTIFIAISDGQHNTSSDNVDSSSTSSFIFAYTKGGFSPYSQFIDEIEREVVLTADGKAHENKSETIEENRIAVTLASVFGLAIPFSSSGRIIFDVYPAKISEQQFAQRILQDAYINMMQQFTLLKKSNVESLKIREMAGKTEEARLKIPKKHFDKSQVTTLLQQIILTSELMSKILQNQPLPYGLPAIYLGLLLSGLGVVFLVILVKEISKKHINTESNDLNNTGNLQILKIQADTDAIGSQIILKWVKKIMHWAALFDIQWTVFHRWIINFNETPEDTYSYNLSCICRVFFYAAVSLLADSTRQISIKILIVFSIVSVLGTGLSDISIHNTSQSPLLLTVFSVIFAGMYFLLQTFVFANNRILPALQTLVCVVFFLLQGLQGNNYLNLPIFDEKPEILYGSLFAVSLMLRLLDCKHKRTLGSSFSEVFIICMAIAAIEPSSDAQISMIPFGVFVWSELLGSSETHVFIPLISFLILFTLLEPQTALLSNKSPAIGYLSNVFGFSLNSSAMLIQILTTVLASMFVAHILKVSLHFSQQNQPSSSQSSSNSGIFARLKQIVSKKNAYFPHSLSVFLPFIIFLSISCLEFEISFIMSYKAMNFDLNTSTHSLFIDMIIASFIASSVTCVAIAYAVKPPVKLHPSQEKKNKKSKKPYEMLDEPPSKIIDSEATISMEEARHQEV